MQSSGLTADVECLVEDPVGVVEATLVTQHGAELGERVCDGPQAPTLLVQFRQMLHFDRGDVIARLSGRMTRGCEAHEAQDPVTLIGHRFQHVYRTCLQLDRAGIIAAPCCQYPRPSHCKGSRSAITALLV